MKKIFFALLLLIGATPAHAASICAYDNGAPIVDSDTFVYTESCSGTPATKKALASEIAEYVLEEDSDIAIYRDITPSANVQSLLGAADYAAMRTLLDLEAGTDFNAYDADLTTYAGITPSANVQTVLAAADNAAIRTALSLVPGTNVLANVVEDTTPQLGGALDANGQNITDGHQFQMDAYPDADHTANGLTTATIDAGATIAIGELVYLASDGEFALADADAAATTNGMLAIAMAAGTDNATMLVAMPGSFVRDDSYNWTVGATLYAGTTPGAIVETAPSGDADIVRAIGYAVTADVIWFQPGTPVEVNVP